MCNTRSGEMVSPQIARMGLISNLGKKDFQMADGTAFNIKNDGNSAVMLEVQLAGMGDNETVTTLFEVGWNPEIVKAVKQTSLSSLNLKWGY